jgi:hypothetical protein
MVVNKIFKYLKGTTKFGLWYLKGNELTVISYTDANCEGSIDAIRSTSRAAFYLGDYLVSWLSNK